MFKKIKLLNKTVLDCLNESDEKKIVKAFTELGIKILDANFGFVWLNSGDSKKFELSYKTRNLPYKPLMPKRYGRNYKVVNKGTPDFVSDMKKRKDQYDVSQYMKSFVIIPIAYRGKAYGNIVFCFKKREIFSKEKKILCSSIGHSVAQSINILRGEMIIRQSETRYRRLFEEANDGIIIIDPKTERITDTNPFMAKLLGYSREEFLGKRFFEIGLFKGQSENDDVFKELKAKGSIHYDCLTVFDKNGRHLEIELSGNLYRENGHKLIQCNIRDITVRKFEEKMFRQQRLLEEESLKKEFIADIAHEFRTPLTIIKGNIDLAFRLKGKKANNVYDTLRAVDEEVSHLSGLLFDLSILTVQSGTFKRKIAPGKIKLRPFLESIKRRCKTLTKDNDISIIIKPFPSITVFGDKFYLDKLFLNLIKNAITYGKKRGRVSIEAFKDENWVRIKISDNGVGIRAEDLPHIFERFYRVDKSRTNRERSGLGLAIAKWIAEAHGGSIRVSSIFGKGSAFTVSIPLIL